MKKLNVLQFITPAGFYGAERWVLAFANNVDNSLVRCDLAVTRESEDQDLTLAELYPVSDEQKVYYMDMRGRFDLRVIRQLCQIIRDRDIHVIHTHGYKSDILGLIAARRTGIRCVSTPHGFSGKVGFKLGAFIRLGTHMLRYFDRVVPLSEELMKEMDRFGVPKSRTRFVRNGVDLTELDSAKNDQTPPRHGLDERLITVGFIGQLIPRKGLPDLLDVFDGLYRKNPSLQLLLLGDGRQRPGLEARASELESESAIHFLGFRSDRLALLSGFDLFVMTSSLEGIPRCLMEAMAMGVPVVAYDIPGVDQLVKHEHTGLLAPHGDKKSLSDCCQRLLDDPQLAERLVQNARTLIEQHYSAARMALEYEVIFQEMTGGAHKVAPSTGRAI